ncbi:hypothetical protein [Streptomyces sp. NPDC088752]|uniref:hypothetical protein n=1 Tax=Streptomyces sp. NPDC088752 TaxID=3154963 RepID=UPI00343F9E68
MATRDDLHHLVDQLPEGAVASAATALGQFTEDSSRAALREEFVKAAGDFIGLHAAAFREHFGP